MIARRLFVLALAVSMAVAHLSAQEKAVKQEGKKPTKDAAGCCESMTKASGSRGECGGKDAKVSKAKRAATDNCCEGGAMTKAEGKKAAKPAPPAPKDKE